MPESSQEPLAIVGIGCRLPGKSNNPESFWDLLIHGKSAIREVPPDRWDVDRYYHEDVAVPIKMITKWGGFVDEVDQFDASFFGISPRVMAVRLELKKGKENMMIFLVSVYAPNSSHTGKSR